MVLHLYIAPAAVTASMCSSRAILGGTMACIDFWALFLFNTYLYYYMWVRTSSKLFDVKDWRHLDRPIFPAQYDLTVIYRPSSIMGQAVLLGKRILWILMIVVFQGCFLGKLAIMDCQKSGSCDFLLTRGINQYKLELSCVWNQWKYPSGRTTLNTGQGATRSTGS
jgi:hypothetical protein